MCDHFLGFSPCVHEEKWENQLRFTSISENLSEMWGWKFWLPAEGHALGSSSHAQNKISYYVDYLKSAFF